LLRGECAALIGPNGAGKTTFLKTILGQIDPWAGSVKLGANLDVGYFAQAHQDLKEDHTVLEEIQKAGQFESENAARSHLGAYLFSGDDVFKQVKILSGGERGRLALAKLSLTNANLLLLDEPTNHLDIPSQETLQAVLAAYPGTILLVSHDRYLINALSSQIWEIDIDEENLFVIEGNYQSLHSSLQSDQSQDDLSLTTDKESLETYKDQKAAKNKSLAANRKRESRLLEIEERISELEGQIQAIGNKLMDPPDNPEEVADLGKDYRDTQTELEILLGEWEDLLKSDKGNK
jgi:ATP-binding cassette subfamily F protein 3